MSERREIIIKKQGKHSKKSIKRNYIFNLSYQLFLIIVPVFVTPYVSRVLGVDGTGKYSYTYSITTYFTLFAALGFNSYAQRLVAGHQGDREQQSRDFWEVFLARLIPTGLTLIVYCSLVFFNVYGEKYSTLMWVLSIDVIAVAFNIVFFFQGNEEFGKIVFRNAFIKCVSIFAIFFFVKKETDLLLYAFIQVASILIGNISLWVYLPKYLVKVKISELKPLKHLGSTLILFLPTIATSVYTSLDKTMIGIITGSDSENGNYEYAEKLVKMVMTVITSLGTVMVPRNSQNFARGNLKAVEHNIYQSCKFVLFIGIPMALGLAAVADNMIPWYLGVGYDKAAILMKMLSPLVIIIGFSNVFGIQFLVPCHMDRKYTVAIISGAVANFCLNCVLIHFWGSYGAAIATIMAEFVVTSVMFYFIKEYINFKQVIMSSWKYVISGAVMFSVVNIAFQNLTSSILHTGIMIACGVAVYFILLLILREDYVYMVLNIISQRVKEIKKG